MMQATGCLCICICFIYRGGVLEVSAALVLCTLGQSDVRETLQFNYSIQIQMGLVRKAPVFYYLSEKKNKEWIEKRGAN